MSKMGRLRAHLCAGLYQFKVSPTGVRDLGSDAADGDALLEPVRPHRHCRDRA